MQMLFLMFGGPELVFLVIIVLSLAIPFWTLADVLKGRFAGQDKLIWVLVILFLPFVGSLLYWVIGAKQRNKV